MGEIEAGGTYFGATEGALLLLKGGLTTNFPYRALGPQNPPNSTKYPKKPILGHRVPNLGNSYLGLKSTSYAIDGPMV